MWGSRKGLVPALETVILHVGRLGSELRSRDRGEPIPERLYTLNSVLCGTLRQNFSSGGPLALFLGADAEVVIDANLKLAWQLAALLYYQNCCSTGLHWSRTFDAAENQILRCLDKVEDIKALLEPDADMRGEPVLWPAFIASCNASTGRPGWQRWWERLLSEYHSYIINRKWRLVQIVWQMADSVGDPHFDWVSFLEPPGEESLDDLLQSMDECLLDGEISVDGGSGDGSPADGDFNPSS
ncbi:hypothetical protein N7530_005301 [Penicillium desertorum]|uniref:Uncharacterized protein n=1 Tax=Penicillium desertorum TaxID=1303715 RepID=A0A9W9X095_9EURO|nr:hypothetical protein N7530_005301 [Penicillium desertorum]